MRRRSPSSGRLTADPVRLMPAVSVLEATCVLSARRCPAAVMEISLFLSEFRIQTVPFDGEQLAIAQQAWMSFGRGRHAARLNFGDCACYALARFRNEPLLFLGNDFARTDALTVPIERRTESRERPGRRIPKCYRCIILANPTRGSELEQRCVMRAIARRGVLSILAAGSAALAQQYVISNFAGARLPATAAKGTAITIPYVHGVTADASGNVYFTLNHHAAAFKLGADGMVTRIAGTGAFGGYLGEGGPALNARFGMLGLDAVDSSGNLYIASLPNSRVVKVTPDGIITTVAGTGVGGYSGDGGPAVKAQLWGPEGVALDSQGNLYVSEWFNHCVRKVTPDGTIATVAGTGKAGYSGDGGPAVKAQLNTPTGLVLDAFGNLFIAEWNNHCIREVTPMGPSRP